jgi:DNA-binding response OmpR family regulator
MSSAIQNTKILAVDTSPAMLEVLKNFAGKQGYDLDSHSDPADAVSLIERRVERFDEDFRCVLLGWPQGDTGIITELLAQLSAPDHQDLPLIIICQEQTAEVEALVKRRAKTDALLWKDYQQAADLIDRMPLAKPRPLKLKPARATVTSQVSAESQTDTGVAAPGVSVSGKRVRALLVDSAPSICHTLKNQLLGNGYDVTLAESVPAAREALKSASFDLIVSDYHLHDSRGSNRLRAFYEAWSASEVSGVLVVVSAKYTDQVIRHSLSAGAAACLFKNESGELLFARIHALTMSLSSKRSATHSDPASVDKASGETNGAVETQTAALQSVATVAASNDEELAVDQAGMDTPEPPVAVETSAVEVAEVEVAEVAEPEVPEPEVPEVAEPELPVGAVSREVFRNTLQETLALVADEKHSGIRYSVLLLDVQIEAGTGDRLSVGDSAPMCQIVEEALGRLYKRPLSLAYLGNGQFAMLLANRNLQDALMLTRKVLQVVPKMVRYLNDMTLVSHAAVVQIDGQTVSPDEFFQRCRGAVTRTRKDRRDNCALILPLKKYLTALESDQKEVDKVAG